MDEKCNFFFLYEIKRVGDNVGDCVIPVGELLGVLQKKLVYQDGLSDIVAKVD